MEHFADAINRHWPAPEIHISIPPIAANLTPEEINALDADHIAKWNAFHDAIVNGPEEGGSDGL